MKSTFLRRNSNAIVSAVDTHAIVARGALGVPGCSKRARGAVKGEAEHARPVNPSCIPLAMMLQSFGGPSQEVLERRSKVFKASAS